jgi:signal transduction histidine kinase
MLIPPERADEENQMLERLKGGEAIKHCETVRVTKDRRRLEVSLTISPLNDSQGRVGGVSQIVRDIGELVRARQVLARSREDLERLVTERTAKLQETVAELEHFSYTITHDMRAPLRAMRGLGGILLEECSDCLHPARREYIRRIADSADRMDMLITDALQYSGAIRQHVELEPVDASAILRGILESYPAFQPPHANIHIDSSLPVVLGYTAGLTQCFSNLLGNAVKFVHPGQTPEVRIWAEVNFGEPQGKAQQEPDAQQTTGNFQGPLPPLIDHLSPAVDHVRIWFEDKGIGIEKEYHDKIWQMFQQLNKSYEGTGIGLALVRKVVDRMNGKVGVESEPGKGSRFWVELQRAGGPPLPPPHNDQLARYPLR